MNTKIIFKETQLFYLAVLPLIFIVGLVITFYVFEIGTKKADIGTVLFVTLCCLPFLAVFYKLKTTITESYLEISFGFGLVKKKIALSTINLKSISPKDIPLKYGIGLRYTFQGGMVCNTYPGEGVSFVYAGNKTIAIGTKKTTEFVSKLKIAITRAQETTS